MISRETRNRLIRIVLYAVATAGIVFLVQLQLGFTNVGQEFGTYGPYNRVLNVVDEMEELEVVNSRLRRRLEFGYFSTLENFAVTVEDGSGRRAVIEFNKGAKAFEESNRERLREIIWERAQRGFAASDTRAVE